MDQPPAHHLSSMAHSVPKDTHTFDASAIYPSPVSATTSQGLRITPIGLGISGCGLEPGFDNFRTFLGSAPFAASQAASKQMITTEDYYGNAMEDDHFSGEPCFSNYNGVPPMSDGPLTTYDLQSMGVSPSFNSALESNEPSSYAGQAPAYWTSMSCSGPKTSLEAACVTGHWNQPLASEPCITVRPPTIPVRRGSNHPTIATNETRTLDSQYNSAQISSSPRCAVSTEGFSQSSLQNVDAHRSISNLLDKNMEDGRKCPVCGYVFTRRSNCTEHQKRHDPTFRKIYTCHECKKTFGRNADLRRHTDNASEIRGPDKGTC
ncbi:hypothetical protein N7523_000139 [Penicillium sp. IBT 18751x]|nr:hypothetical protein N7523_000139 [Penicillium sp. IBT 18751x]